ncbi:MAG: SCP2 sterol-binding domain-containing protein [Candidatus Binatia bacterium]
MDNLENAPPAPASPASPTLPAPPTVQDRVREIFSAFEAQGAAEAATSRSFLLKLGGSATGTFLLEAGPSGVHWKTGDGESADATIKIDTSDFIAIADGSLDGRLALASEKIELEGDLAAAADMLKMFFPADPDA